MLSSTEFDQKLQINNFQQLENEFQQAKKFFENLNTKIKCTDVPLKFPAFCLLNQEIRIKFPTYKIRIINNKMSYKDLQLMIKDKYRYIIYDEANVVMPPSLKPIHSTAIHCLETNLNANTHAADEIEKNLNEHHVYTQRCVDSGQYCIPIKVDKEGYITIIKTVL